MKPEIGSAYYPEDWDLMRVEHDAKLMQEAGVTLARIGEFAWSHMEPSDGKFDLKWLKDSLDILGKHGVKTVLCTPTSTAPAWLSKKHPEILRENFEGKRAYFGIRDQTCYSSPVYMEYVRRIITKMLEATWDCKNIVAWQIDNEAGHSVFQQCCCPGCQDKFRKFLKKKYKTLDKLNKSWGMVFWSQEYADWDEIRLANCDYKLNSAAVLDTFRFHSETMTEFVMEQYNLIRKARPKVLITANNPSGYFDKYEFCRRIDFAAPDYYPCFDGLNLDCMISTSYYPAANRGFKPETPHWMMESAVCPGAPSHNLIKFFLWKFLANGCDNMLFFHWRSHLSGYEKTHCTFLPPSGVPGYAYDVAREVFLEFRKIFSKDVDLPLPRQRAAVIFDCQTLWNYCQGFMTKWANYENLNVMAFNMLWRNGLNADVISPYSDLSRYEVVYLPQQRHITKKFAKILKDYVSEGGTLIVAGGTGIADGNSNWIPEEGPEHIKELLGVDIRSFMTFGEVILNPIEPHVEVCDKDMIFSGKLGRELVRGEAGLWTGLIRTTTASTILTWENTIYKNMPFLTHNQFGKGNVFYYAADSLDPVSNQKIVKYCLDKAKIKGSGLPLGIEMMERGKYVFYFNNSAKDASFKLPVSGKCLVGNARNRTVRLPAYDVCVLMK